MGFFAKLLTILVLLLSAAYAGVSAVLFTKRQDFKTFWQTEKTERAEEKQNLDGEIAKLDSRCREIETLKKQVDGEVKRLDLALKREMASNKRLEGDLAGRSKDLSELQIMNKQLVDQLTVEKKETARLQAKAEKLDKELETARTSIRDKNTDIQSLKDARAEQDRKLGETNVALRDTKQELGLTGRMLKTAVENGFDPGSVDAKEVTGQVLDVQGNIVVIDRGKQHGVMIGSEYSVYSRQRGYVGKMRVKDVRHDLAYGSPIRDLTVKPIQVGDNVTNRLR